jgi:hypothetical protein
MNEDQLACMLGNEKVGGFYLTSVICCEFSFGGVNIHTLLLFV